MSTSTALASRSAVHPFPARMAPELAANKVASLNREAVVLDPMMGSGTFPIAAARSGHVSIGCDSDPLAIIIAETLRGNYDPVELVQQARVIAETAKSMKDPEISVDAETSSFIDFWFDPVTRRRLSALALQIRDAPERLRAPLWCSFSRLIITKDSGASRARDVSHSRPHRVRDMGSFDPVERFAQSAQIVSRRVSDGAAESEGSFSVLRADARCLPLRDHSVDAVMTSPPYLIAIDYLRGHRMSLVWMGYSVSSLRTLRSTNVGSEAGADAVGDVADIARSSVNGTLTDRGLKIVNRYVSDIDRVMSEITRVMKPSGRASFVIADAKLQGAFVSIEKILTLVSLRHGLSMNSRFSRDLPESRRYLPPPREASGSLNLRMKQEIVLEFTH